jgi:predicted MPP superfamily phosphohydrolase
MLTSEETRHSAHATGRMSNRRRFLVGAGVAAIGAPTLAAAATAWGYDPDWLSVERRRIVVPGLDRPRIAVQVSDLHADRQGSCSPLLRERVEAQIRRIAPDWIFATGDYVTRPGDDIADAASWVAGLPAREGTFAVMGNHDSPPVKQALLDRGVAVLDNTWTKVNGIVIAGVGDLGRWPHEPQQVLATVPRGVGSILLAHQPDSFWMYDRPVTLQISGHTHGGQVTVFGIWPGPRIVPHLKNLMLHVPKLEKLARKDFVETRRNAWSGFFRRDDGSTLYVNRGLGRFKRISFYCPPELTVWELLPREDDRV